MPTDRCSSTASTASRSGRKTSTRTNASAWRTRLPRQRATTAARQLTTSAGAAPASGRLYSDRLIRSSGRRSPAGSPAPSTGAWRPSRGAAGRSVAVLAAVDRSVLPQPCKDQDCCRSASATTADLLVSSPRVRPCPAGSAGLAVLMAVQRRVFRPNQHRSRPVIGRSAAGVPRRGPVADTSDADGIARE